MENVTVLYKKEYWSCDLPVRKSLFSFYVQCNPNYLVYIRREDRDSKLLKVSELVLI